MYRKIGEVAELLGITPVFAHADTVEEVAAIVGIDAAGLKETVERYNGFVEAGVDADFGRLADFLKAKIGEGPYYIVEQKPRFAMRDWEMTGRALAQRRNIRISKSLKRL